MRIRPATADDVPALAGLFTAAVHELTADHYNPQQRAAWAPQPPDIAAWRQRLAPLHTLVAEIDAEPAGFIGYDAGGHIALIFTAPTHARRGIAAALLQAAETALFATGVTRLTTAASAVAHPFFKAQGFIDTEAETVTRNGIAFNRYRMVKAIG